MPKIKNMEIRVAEENDILSLASMQLIAWQQDYQKTPLDKPLYNFFVTELHTRWQKKIRSDYKTLVLEAEGVVHGFITYRILHNYADGSTVEISNLFVAAETRSQGFGTALWHHMLQDLYHHIISEVIVWILKDDIHTQAFYEKLGLMATKKTRSERIGKNVFIQEVMLHLPYQHRVQQS